MRLLTRATAGGYLLGRGLLDSLENVQIVGLGGGISNVVLGVTAPRRRMVLKQALPRLRVADEWLAEPERALTEAAATTLANRLVPGSAPSVLDTDPEQCILVLESAPKGWGDWKSQLLAGQADTEVARQLGIVLAEWQSRTFDDSSVAESLGETKVFEQLRLDPYYRTTAKRRPELAGDLQRYERSLSKRRRCLVHGDYSPKNVLVPTSPCTAPGLWLIDFEVAHVGDPAFDPAFLLSHLLLKTVHRPWNQNDYLACAMAFWSTYGRGTPRNLRPDLSYVLGHVGCLMAARVDGKSPVEYLSDEMRERTRYLARELLRNPPQEIQEAWARATAEATG